MVSVLCMPIIQSHLQSNSIIIIERTGSRLDESQTILFKHLNTSIFCGFTLQFLDNYRYLLNVHSLLLTKINKIQTKILTYLCNLSYIHRKLCYSGFSSTPDFSSILPSLPTSGIEYHFPICCCKLNLNTQTLL